MKFGRILAVALTAIILSCDDEGSKPGPNSPIAQPVQSGHTISSMSMMGSDSAYRYQQTYFLYEGDILAGTKSMAFGRQSLADPFVLGTSSLAEYHYISGRLDQIKNSEYPNYTVSYTYGTDGSVTAVWAGAGRSNGYDTYQYGPSGKLQSMISKWKYPTKSSESTSKVIWNGDNIESLITETECICGGPNTSIITYDTVSYLYGEGFNPFSDSKYVGYTESLGAKVKIPFASKNILMEQNNVTESFVYVTDEVRQHTRLTTHHALSYVLDDEKYPLKIKEEITPSGGSPYVLKSEIEY